MRYTEENIRSILNGSNGERTRKLYDDLKKFGAIGRVGISVFRATKTSYLAKKYTGTDANGTPYAKLSYEKKTQSLEWLCNDLSANGDRLGITWGWLYDKPSGMWALYIDLPMVNRQVSFHSPKRFAGAEYPGKWDGIRGEQDAVVIAFVHAILERKNQ